MSPFEWMVVGLLSAIFGAVLVGCLVLAEIRDALERQKWDRGE